MKIIEGIKEERKKKAKEVKKNSRLKILHFGVPFSSPAFLVALPKHPIAEKPSAVTVAPKCRPTVWTSYVRSGGPRTSEMTNYTVKAAAIGLLQR